MALNTKALKKVLNEVAAKSNSSSPQFQPPAPARPATTELITTPATAQSTARATSNAPRRRLRSEDVKAMGLKSGGYVKAADGVCKKGKTRGKMV